MDSSQLAQWLITRDPKLESVAIEIMTNELRGKTIAKFTKDDLQQLTIMLPEVNPVQLQYFITALDEYRMGMPLKFQQQNLRFNI
jgi:hypothetical protein